MSAGRALSDLWVTQLNDSQKPDALIGVPMFGQKLLKKGFNQADIICNHLSKRLDIPRWKGIARTHATPPLEGLIKAERARAVKGAFEVIKKPPNSVAIIDDVFTTGSTVTEITHQLKRAGCQHVIIWALARTPLS
jgi:ComF family protein